MKNIFSICLAIILVLILVFFTFAQNTVPKKSGKLKLSGLKKEVKVYYDNFGIPHIEALSEEDGYMALGFLIASDRLFQMDLLRRLVNGSLSEIFGNKTIEADTLLRKLRFKKSAESLYEKYKDDPVTQKANHLAQQFLNGVDQFIATRPLPLEFKLLDYKPEPFTIPDIMGLSGYMALTFAEGLNGDIFLTELEELLPADKMEMLRVGDKVDTDYFSEQKTVKSNILEKINSTLDVLGGIVPLFHGSNSWVLAGRKSVTGYPLLASDPHIGVGNPHIFFEAHLRTPNQEIYGHFIPLSPFPILGHTADTAWGVTMSEIDDLNIYEEKFDPQNANQVKFKNEWVAVERYEEVIKVKGQVSITTEVVVTPHGPLLTGTKFEVDQQQLAVHWSVYHEDNNVLRTLYELPRAKSIDQFKQALSHAAAPGLNITWASKKGDIAWWTLGKFPKLPEGIKTDRILKGWDGSHEVERYYTIDENPHQVNPESGMIVSANYRPQQEEFAHFDGYWQPAGRFFRIEKLLKEKEVWDLEQLKKIQTDNTVPIGTKLTGQLMSLLKKDGLSALEMKAYTLLSNWNGEAVKDSVGSSIYHTLVYYLSYNLYADELGEEGFKKFAKTADFWHSFKKLVQVGNHSFWDDTKTDRVENLSFMLQKSFKQAIESLEQKWGRHAENWRWGKLHQVSYEHPLGKQKPLNIIYNIGPRQADGGRYVINNLGHKKSLNDFSVVHAPATRRLISLENTKESWGILPTGNSGNPFSEHFSDQNELYHQGKYRKQMMDMDYFKKVKALYLMP